MVQEVGKEFELNVKIEHKENPRFENTESPKFYEYKTEILKNYGYKSSRDIKEEIKYCIKYLLNRKENLLGLRNNIYNNIKFK
jgi:hypothetical protein